MTDYQRFVSYIYSYPGGVKDKNVGFAKVEVRSGQLKLNITLRGVYTDTPELFGVYMLVDRDERVAGRYTLLKVGDCVVKSGMAGFSSIYNAENIDSTGYTCNDICGIAVANNNNRYYMMFSMWEDYDINPDAVLFAQKGHKKTKTENVNSIATDESRNQEEAPDDTAASVKAETENDAASDEETVQRDNKAEQEEQLKDTSKTVQGEEKKEDSREAVSEILAAEVGGSLVTEADAGLELISDIASLEPKEPQGFEKLFIRADYVDAFDDDYFYDCIEVSPEMLESMTFKDGSIINNSFLIHGYYNFRHILFGRVCDNGNNTKYFIGVPGMYCNRERYMASMFGFNNFKKSHRSDYSNPYFGYWYQEI